jgi:hypothetical protein
VPVGYAVLLLQTLLVEVPLAVVLAGGAGRRVVVAGAVAVNLFSHPLAHFTWNSGAASYGAIEIGVAFVEVLGYRLAVGLSWRRAIALSALANGVTVALSFLL